MQSFSGQERCRLAEKSRVIAPYSRRNSSSSYMFAGRNLDVPRGRIHYPGDNDRFSMISKDFKNEKASVAYENHFCFPREMNCNNDENIVGSESSSDVAPSVRRNHLKVESEAFQQKFPVQLIGQLSLTEQKTGGVLVPYGDAEARAKSRAKNNFPQEDYHSRRKEYQSRLLTGSVDKVIHWFELKNNVHLLVEVMAPLVDIKSGKFPGEKCLVLRDERTGPSLLVVFYEIDRTLPQLVIGKVVKCIGRPKSRNCVHAFKVEQSSEQEKADSHRLFFISNLVAQEAKSIFGKKL